MTSGPEYIAERSVWWKEGINTVSFSDLADNADLNLFSNMINKHHLPGFPLQLWKISFYPQCLFKVIQLSNWHILCISLITD